MNCFGSGDIHMQLVLHTHMGRIHMVVNDMNVENLYKYSFQYDSIYNFNLCYHSHQTRVFNINTVKELLTFKCDRDLSSKSIRLVS